MKKIILLALAALLIFTMVSCDGNADFLLWNEEEGTEKTIKLEIVGNGYWYFDSMNNISVEITVNANTWGDLKEVALGHNIYHYSSGAFENTEFSSYYMANDEMYVMSVTANSLSSAFSFITTSSVVSSAESYVEPTDEIVDGQTYYVVVSD